MSEAISHGIDLDSPGGGGLTNPYSAAHTIARIKLYESSRAFAINGSRGRHVWRKIFGPITPSTRELHELAAVVNKMTGSMSLGILGISEGQRHLEATLIFPRYLRCLLGLVFDTLHGGIRGNESRIVMASLALTVTVIFTAL